MIDVQIHDLVRTNSRRNLYEYVQIHDEQTAKVFIAGLERPKMRLKRAHHTIETSSDHESVRVDGESVRLYAIFVRMAGGFCA